MPDWVNFEFAGLKEARAYHAPEGGFADVAVPVWTSDKGKLTFIAPEMSYVVAVKLASMENPKRHKKAGKDLDDAVAVVDAKHNGWDPKHQLSEDEMIDLVSPYIKAIEAEAVYEAVHSIAERVQLLRLEAGYDQ